MFAAFLSAVEIAFKAERVMLLFSICLFILKFTLFFCQSLLKLYDLSTKMPSMLTFGVLCYFDHQVSLSASMSLYVVGHPLPAVISSAKLHLVT